MLQHSPSSGEILIHLTSKITRFKGNHISSDRNISYSPKKKIASTSHPTDITAYSQSRSHLRSLDLHFERRARGLTHEWKTSQEKSDRDAEHARDALLFGLYFFTRPSSLSCLFPPSFPSHFNLIRANELSSAYREGLELGVVDELQPPVLHELDGRCVVWKLSAGHQRKECLEKRGKKKFVKKMFGFFFWSSYTNIINLTLNITFSHWRIILFHDCLSFF